MAGQGRGVNGRGVTPSETAPVYSGEMVKVTALLPNGSRFERDYPDSFFDAAWDMHLHGKRGMAIVDALIDYAWPVPPTIVDVIRDEGTPTAKSLRLWC